MKKKNPETLSIGLLVTSLYDQYENTIWGGAQHQAELLGGRLLCFAGNQLIESDITSQSHNSLFNLVGPTNVDALIVLAGSIGNVVGTQKLAQFLHRYEQIPVVCIGLAVPGFTSIIIDNMVGIYNLVSHMIEVHDCKRLAFVKGPENNDEANARYTAYCNSLKDHGIPFDPSLVCPGDFIIDSGPNAVRTLLDERCVSFDALLCVDDFTALSAMSVLRDRKYQIPGDVRITGFDDIEYSQSSAPPLTTVRQPLFEIGRTGVRLIHAILKGEFVPEVTEFPTHLMVRESCGCSSYEIFKSLLPQGIERSDRDTYSDTIAAPILTELEQTYGFIFSPSEADDLSNKIRHFIQIIMKAAADTTHTEKVRHTLEDLVTTFFEKGMTVSLWQGILSCVFEELAHAPGLPGDQRTFEKLLNVALVALFQTESYLQSQKRITMEMENENVQYIGDLLITSFNHNEIKKILDEKLHVVHIRETFFSSYERDRTYARLIYAQDKKSPAAVEKTVFPATELVPGGIKNSSHASYCIMHLTSENDEFGFVLFRTTDTRGSKYDTLADKIASAVNGARLVETIQQQNIALRKSEEDLRIALNSIGDAVVVTDAKGNVTRMNPVAEDLTGWQSFKALGKPLLEVFNIAIDRSRRDIEDMIHMIVERGRPVRLPGHIILISKDKTERRVNYSGAPLRSADGPIIGAVIVFRDVTEQFMMEEQLRQTQKMDAIGQLAGGVAHDFNNMLAGIMGYAELIIMKTGDNEKLRKFAQIILNSAENTAELTQKLLAFSRKAKMQSSPVDVHTCIKDAIQILKHSIDRRIIIRKEMKADIATARGDPSQIQNAILNLALNARDAMPDGGELTFASANVTLNREYCDTSPFDIQPGIFIEISICDTGAGMSKEVQEQIFDPFFTTKDIGKGTGLGLAAVYGIVRDHHGAIHVYSELNKGTVFKVYVPVDSSVSIPHKYDEAELHTGSGNILVIDDEKIIRDVLAIQLQEMGYSVLTAHDGVEGVELFQDNHAAIDLVILDMVMPKMSGQDTFSAIRSIDSDVKILLLSGFSRDLHKEDLLKQGAIGFVQKPFRRAEIGKILAQHMKTAS